LSPRHGYIILQDGVLYSQLTQEKIMHSFRNIAKNDLAGTVRSSGLRGIYIHANCGFNWFTFCFLLYIHI